MEVRERERKSERKREEREQHPSVRLPYEQGYALRVLVIVFCPVPVMIQWGPSRPRLGHFNNSFVCVGCEWRSTEMVIDG